MERILLSGFPVVSGDESSVHRNRTLLNPVRPGREQRQANVSMCRWSAVEELAAILNSISGTSICGARPNFDHRFPRLLRDRHRFSQIARTF